MYNRIVNPLTNRKVNINSKLGKKIILNYLNILNGGASEVFMEDLEPLEPLDPLMEEIKKWEGSRLPHMLPDCHHSGIVINECCRNLGINLNQLPLGLVRDKYDIDSYLSNKHTHRLYSFRSPGHFWFLEVFVKERTFKFRILSAWGNEGGFYKYYLNNRYGKWQSTVDEFRNLLNKLMILDSINGSETAQEKIDKVDRIRDVNEEVYGVRHPRDIRLNYPEEIFDFYCNFEVEILAIREFSKPNIIKEAMKRSRNVIDKHIDSDAETDVEEEDKLLLKSRKIVDSDAETDVEEEED